jgi:hypothetical protein
VWCAVCVPRLLMAPVLPSRPPHTYPAHSDIPHPVATTHTTHAHTHLQAHTSSHWRAARLVRAWCPAPSPVAAASCQLRYQHCVSALVAPVRAWTHHHARRGAGAGG